MSIIRKYMRLKGYRFVRKDLEELCACMAEGITNKPVVTFYLESKYRDITKDGLEELFADTSIPSILHDLGIRCSATLPPSYEYRSASVSLSTGRSSLEVIGNDEVWVEGKSQQIRNFLRPREANIRHFLARFGGPIIWIVMVSISIVLFNLDKTTCGVAIMIIATLFTIASVVWEKCNVPLNVIHLRDIEENWFKRNASTFVAAAIGAILGAAVTFALTKLFQ